VVELIAKSPCAGLLPLAIGAQTAAEADPGVLTAILPYRGQDDAVSAALEAAHGMAAPAPGRATGRQGARAIWFGRGQLLLAGPAPDPALAASAALVDQSDAWACVELSGPEAEDVLARLVPVDLRAGQFKRGHTARSQIGHMNGSVTRIGAERFLLMVFRSMAATLAHDLKDAMETVAARR
jgi:sarcosine oxidase subunit gamma